MRKYNESAMTLLRLIDQYPNMSIEELSEYMYLTRTSVTNYIKQFKEEKLIVTFSGKNTKCRRLLTNKGRLLLTKE